MPSVHANRRSSAPSESRGRPVVLASLLLARLLGLVSAGAWWGGWFGVKEDPRLTEVKTVMAEAAAKYPPDQAPKNMLDTAARVGTMVTVMAKIQALPEDLRPKALEEGRKLMMKGMEARVDSYFAAHRISVKNSSTTSSSRCSRCRKPLREADRCSRVSVARGAKAVPPATSSRQPVGQGRAPRRIAAPGGSG